jgi:hypothetical protein
MTSSEAAYRLLRHASITDLAALGMSDAADLMGALSRAIGTFFRYGPAVLRQTSASTALPAPRTLSGLTIAANAHEVTAGTPFGLSERGASLLIAGDPIRNEVVSTVGWLHPYQGAGGSGKTATLYGDCVPVSSRLVERFLSDPVVIDPAGGEPRRLTRVRHDHEGPARWQAAAATPSNYALQPAGASRGATTQYLMRVFPAPTRQIVLRFECEVQPDMLDFTNAAQVPVELPFSETQMETIVLPLAEAELLTSPLLDAIRPDLIGRIEARANFAMETLKKLPKDHGRPRGRIRTKFGY